MQPTDRQLVDLMSECPAAELAPEQMELLWQRFVDSPELRDELLADIFQLAQPGNVVKHDQHSVGAALLLEDDPDWDAAVIRATVASASTTMRLATFTSSRAAAAV